jgi:hypothetical protein
MVEVAGQAGAEVAAPSWAVRPIKISYEAISAAAQILEASSFGEMSPTIAEGLAEEMLLAALSAEHNR